MKVIRIHIIQKYKNLHFLSKKKSEKFRKRKATNLLFLKKKFVTKPKCSDLTSTMFLMFSMFPQDQVHYTSTMF